MSARLIDFLVRCAPRERLLIFILVVAVLPLALWLGVVAPLQERRVAAEQALEEAQALRTWVSVRAAEMAALEEVETSGPRTPIGLSAIEQSLITAELRDAVAGLSNRSGGGLELRFEAVSFTQLMNWLSREDPVWGYDIDSLILQRGEDPGIVAAELVLIPQT